MRVDLSLVERVADFIDGRADEVGGPKAQHRRSLAADVRSLAHSLMLAPGERTIRTDVSSTSSPIATDAVDALTERLKTAHDWLYSRRRYDLADTVDEARALIAAAVDAPDEREALAKVIAVAAFRRTDAIRKANPKSADERWAQMVPAAREPWLDAADAALARLRVVGRDVEPDSARTFGSPNAIRDAIGEDAWRALIRAPGFPGTDPIMRACVEQYHENLAALRAAGARSEEEAGRG
jgi:hypothetical protein